MQEKVKFDSLLVPVDFSPASEAALLKAVVLASSSETNVIVLHVIEPALIEFAVEHGWGSHQEVAAKMRARAEEKLEQYRTQNNCDVEIDTLVSEGVPFVEILKKAKDFAVDAIVIGRIGVRGEIEKLLFGSTAEKVLRTSHHPVIVFPLDIEKSTNSL